MSEKLIDYIAEKTGLYASDLLIPENSGQILQIIRRIPAELFTPGDWSASLSYLTATRLRFAAPEAAKDYYIKFLTDRISSLK